MAKHFRFPYIAQFRNTVKTVRDRANYHKVPVPALTFVGTVKLHGTNATVVYEAVTDSIYAQSRDRVISIDADNEGFAKYVVESENVLKRFFESLRYRFPGSSHIAVYGEWCGRGIMKGTALNQLDRKLFVIFGVRVITNGQLDEHGHDWLALEELHAIAEEWRDELFTIDVRFIHDYQTWTVTVDFNKPEEAQNVLVSITNDVERECPFGKAHRVSGVGEGVVWTVVKQLSSISLHDLTFKVKGEKHSESKVKTLAPVDIEKVNSINEFVTSVVTDHRLEKMVQKLREAGNQIAVESTGDFLKLVGQDVLKEEGDAIEANALERKEVMPAVSRAARNWWLKFLDKEIMGS